MSKILIAFGTRPEYIKVKSLICNLPNIKTLFTGQHKDLLQDVECDYHLSIDNICDNRLNNIIANILINEYIFEDIDYVLVQGDTSSALAIALSAYNCGKKIIHLEAGLRTYNKNDPYPEEINRQMISRIADINLCPTENNKNNLINEKVSGKIYITGNTGLDNITTDNCEYGNIVLISMHRRDNHNIMDKWFKKIEEIANTYTDLTFIIPLHPNPNVQRYRHIFNRVNIIEPLIHIELIKLMKKCKFIISDSGGLQEEASFLNKKVIICRRTTEREEVLESGHGILCPYPEQLDDIVEKVYQNYKIDEPCPFGDGRSYLKIINILS